MNKYLIFVGILVLLTMFLYGCTETVPEEETISKELFDELQDKYDVELEEHDYTKTMLRNGKLEKEGLQSVYNSLLLDWQSCSMANYCLYYEKDCVAYAKEAFDITGYTAKELHDQYSKLCDGSDRDAEKYYEIYTG